MDCCVFTYAQYGKAQKEHLPALHINCTTWAGGRCPCSWQGGRTGWCLRSLPTQTILWFLTACRKHMQQTLLSLKATKRLPVENPGCIHSAKQQEVSLVTDCYVILPSAQTCLHHVRWSHASRCMLLHVTSSQLTLPQSTWRALAPTENAKKIMLMLACFWHCQKWFKLQITDNFFLTLSTPNRLAREKQECIHVLIMQSSIFLDSLP